MNLIQTFFSFIGKWGVWIGVFILAFHIGKLKLRVDELEGKED